MKLMPLPGDPPIGGQTITVSDEEMAFRKWKIKKAHGAKLSDEFEALVEKHYRPEWEDMRKNRTSPDALAKEKSGGSPG